MDAELRAMLHQHSQEIKELRMIIEQLAGGRKIAKTKDDYRLKLRQSKFKKSTHGSNRY